MDTHSGGGPEHSSTAQPSLSAEEVDRALSLIHAWVRDWMNGEQASRGWEAALGSPLAGDDRYTAPFQTSHTAAAALNVCLDHMHALTLVSAENRVLHLNASFTLARAAIENASIAYWLVAPRARRERVERTLRVHATDVRDATNAMSDLGATPLVDLKMRMAQLHELVSAAGLPESAKALRNVNSTAVVSAVDEALDGAIKPGAVGAWRLFSGMAHARPWASAAFLDREVTPVDGQISKVRRTNSPSRILYTASVAQDVFAIAAKTYEERARSPYT